MPRRPGEGPLESPKPLIKAIVVMARRGSERRSIDVQGEARPFSSVTLYAKVSGYLKRIYVDRGDTVTEGQLLAEIESPEIDRQRQAARADARFKRATAASAAALRDRGAISLRQLESERASADIAGAVVAGLRVQKDSAQLRAPFGGTITARFADPGALVQNATNANTGALPLVTVSKTDQLRIYAYVDQRSAHLVQPGDAADVTLPETGLSAKGNVARINRELDPRTRTMLVEIDLDNREGSIMAGSFVRVRLEVRSSALVEVPAEALLFRENRPFLAVVGFGNRIGLRPVSIGNFDGVQAGITSGLTAGETVALNLGRAAKEGDVIDPVQIEPPPAQSTAKK
jgi:membrane fusion protein (multidrug efflux system)